MQRTEKRRHSRAPLLATAVLYERGEAIGSFRVINASAGGALLEGQPPPGASRVNVAIRLSAKRSVRGDAVVSRGTASAGRDAFAVSFVRLSADGTPDTDFGDDGVVRVRALTGDDDAAVTDVAIAADGKLLVLDFNLIRLNANGTVDPSFNLASRVYPAGRVLALQPDGKVVSSGLYFGPGPGDDERSGLFRLRSDGSLDPEFDARWFNSSSDFYSLALTPEGKIYFGTFSDFALANPDGSRDESFNPEQESGAHGDIAVQPAP